MDKPSILHIGGSIERALKGDYLINVKSILTEAWQQTLLSRISINIGLAFVLSLGMLVSYLTSNYFGGIEVIFQDQEAAMIVNIVVTIVIWPFLAGVEMMGVFHAIKMKTKPLMIFSFLKRGSWVALCALLTSLFVSIGFQLFVIPGIFLGVLLSLTVPLVIEKKMTPMRAIILSLQTLRFKFFPILALYAILLAALFVLMIPIVAFMQYELTVIGVVLFIFGFSFLAPMFYNVKGILYREIFGLDIVDFSPSDGISSDKKGIETKNDSGSDDIFSA